MASRSLLGLRVAGDPGHLELGEPLTVAHPLVVTGLVLVLVDADLRTLGLGDHLSGDRGLGQLVGVMRDVLAVDEQDRGQRDLGARLGIELLDLDDIALSDLVLLAAGLDDGVHRGIHSSTWKTPPSCTGIAGAQTRTHLSMGRRTDYLTCVPDAKTPA